MSKKKKPQLNEHSTRVTAALASAFADDVTPAAEDNPAASVATEETIEATEAGEAVEAAPVVEETQEAAAPTSKKKRKSKKAAEETLEAASEAEESSVEEGVELATDSSDIEIIATEDNETQMLDAETLADLGVEATEVQETTEHVAVAPVDSTLITDIGEIENVLEAIIFAAPKAVTTLKLKNLLRSFSYDVSNMTEILESMIQRQDMHGFQLIKVGGGYQFRTHPKHAEVMQKMLEDRPAKLSPSALEVLSIIAYKQPITRAEIDSVRGVDSGHLMKGLLEKNLIRTQGHAETAGRPMLYGSAPYFLEVFGLNSLDDLPALDEMSRELVSSSADGSDETLVLSAHAGDMIDTSGLSANPDRGNFDDPLEETFEEPDFGVKERALEN